MIKTRPVAAALLERWVWKLTGKRYKGISWVEIFCILFGVLVTQVNIFVKTHQTKCCAFQYV